MGDNKEKTVGLIKYLKETVQHLVPEENNKKWKTMDSRTKKDNAKGHK
jgi:hypothetical protein